MVISYSLLLCLLLHGYTCQEVSSHPQQPPGSANSSTPLPFYANAGNIALLISPFPLTLHYNLYNLITVTSTGEILLTGHLYSSNVFSIRVLHHPQNKGNVSINASLVSSNSPKLIIQYTGYRTGQNNTRLNGSIQWTVTFFNSTPHQRLSIEILNNSVSPDPKEESCLGFNSNCSQRIDRSATSVLSFLSCGIDYHQAQGKCEPCNKNSSAFALWGVCKKIAGCQIYTAEGKCFRCKDGYLASSDGLCFIGPGCIGYNSSTKSCISCNDDKELPSCYCQEGYQADRNGSCIDCHCVCTANSSQCSACGNPPLPCTATLEGSTIFCIILVGLLIIAGCVMAVRSFCCPRALVSEEESEASSVAQPVPEPAPRPDPIPNLRPNPHPPSRPAAGISNATQATLMTERLPQPP